MAQILLATESSRSRAPQLDSRHLLNFMVEPQPQEAKAQTPLFTCPGIAAYHDTRDLGSPTGPNRGFVEHENGLWGVFGSGFWRIDDTGDPVWSGGPISGTNPVGITNNPTQVIIVNGLQAWTYDTTNGLELITDDASYPSRTVAFMDGFFVRDRRGTNQFFVSDANNGRAYNALAFASAEAEPGEVVAVAANMQFLTVFTTTHFELWYNAGLSPFPFARYAGGTGGYGCISPYTVVQQDSALWFAGKDRCFYRLDANRATKVSTWAVEQILSEETDADYQLAECDTYTTQGHKIINLTLRGGARTISFDVTTGKWHDRDSVDALFNSLGRYRARGAINAFGKIIVGDAFTGLVGQLDWSTYAEYGNPMRGQIRTLNQHKDRYRVFCSRFELDMQFGTGVSTGQGMDPRMRLRRSVDGGMSFGAWQPPRSIGLVGEYGRRARWLRQGQGREMLWDLEYAGPIPATVIQAHADMLQGYN